MTETHLSLGTHWNKIHIFACLGTISPSIHEARPRLEVHIEISLAYNFIKMMVMDVIGCGGRGQGGLGLSLRIVGWTGGWWESLKTGGLS